MKPGFTLSSLAWILGFGTLLIGIIKMVFTFRTQAFVPNSGSRMLSALIDIFFGCFILFHLYEAVITLPLLFAVWVIIEGISTIVQSFIYKGVGFGGWWGMLLLGIAATFCGFFGFKNLAATASLLSTLVGIAIILIGLGYLIGVIGMKRFEKQ